MSYAERVLERPNCWGNVDAYNPQDNECSECRFQHTCRAECMRKSGQAQAASIPIRRVAPATSYNTFRPQTYQHRGYDQRDEIERVDWQPGLVREGESAVSRFFKDAASGGLRGSFYEMYRFWRGYRFP